MLKIWEAFKMFYSFIFFNLRDFRLQYELLGFPQ